MIIRLLITFLALIPALAHAQIRVTPESQQQMQLSFAPVVKKVAPAVVNIYTKRKVTVRAVSPFFNDPFFSQFFGQGFGGGMSRERMESSLGSGVIIAPSGQVVTNAHVIKDAAEIKVVLADGREFAAELSLQDDASDLAILQIKSPDKNLPYANLKPSESLEVGDIVLAIGNPFGVGQTVTSGIVSAQGRSSLNINDFNFFIQTDAAINPGNSGGALVTLDGNVVGINTAIYSRDGGSQGIGFAVPSEMVRSVLTAAASGQSGNAGIIRPWLGVHGQTVTADIAESLGLPIPRGILIAKLHAQSPLSRAGIRTGDVVTAMNNRPLRDPSEMKFRMATVPLGDSADIEILRAGEAMTFKVKAIAPPEDPPRNEVTMEGNHPFSGATIANINPALAVEIGTTSEEGVIITKTSPRSYAARVVRSGDMIKSINGKTINTVKDAQNALSRPPENGAWDITINSGGQDRRVLLR